MNAWPAAACTAWPAGTEPVNATSCAAPLATIRKRRVVAQVQVLEHARRQARRVERLPGTARRITASGPSA